MIIIMSIFNNDLLFESADEFENLEDQGFDVEPTVESAMEMGFELTESVYKLNTSLYITDLLLEQRSAMGEDVEVALEAAVKDYFVRFKAWVERFWAKVKAFFANIGKKLEATFSTGQHFIKKYKSGIKNAFGKGEKDYEYTVLHAVSKDEVRSNINLICRMNDGKISDYSSLESVINKAKSDVAGNKDVDAHIKADEARVVSQLTSEAKTYAEARAILSKKLGGKKNVGERKILTGTDAETMLEFVEWYVNGGKRELKNKFNATKVAVDNAKKLIKRAESDVNKAEAAKENGGKMGSYTKVFSAMTAKLNFIQWLNAKSLSSAAGTYRYYMGVLRGFAAKNSKLITRESLEVEETKNANSLLESVLEAF